MMGDQPQNFKKNPALAALEKVMLFDQSQSSKWPRITIYVEQGGGVDQFQDETVLVYPNGRTYDIARSANAKVPPEVVDALYLCLSGRQVKDPKAATGYSTVDVLRFPFRMVDADSVRRYDKWKNALEILRTVVTETRSKPLPDGKVVHEVTARYLPDEILPKAAEILEWLDAEAEKDKEVAADKSANAA